MAVPKRRKSKAQSRKRRSANIKAVAPHVAYCTQCGTAVKPHVVCPNCGYYQGRTLVEPED